VTDTSPSRDRLYQRFDAVERQLEASLDAVRADLDHSGNKGAALESALRAFLASHLSARFSVGQGEVYDSHGGRSPQVDVIVNTDDQPFVFAPEDVGSYMYEGVVAIGESKARLTSQEIDDAATKAEKFRRLRHSGTDMALRFGVNVSDSERFWVSPPTFLFAYETSMSADSVKSKLESLPDVPAENQVGRLPPLDAVFALGLGAFINLGDGKGQLAALDPVSEQYLQGWTYFGQGPTLAHMFMWLHSAMPRHVRFQSIAVPYFADVRT
jgi:hypothetical protein